VFPDASSERASGSDLPLVLPDGEARLIAERWLTEARVARDSARFVLPPSSAHGVGDVVALDMGDGPSSWRIDRVTLSGPREVEATRVEPGIYGYGETDLGQHRALRHDAPAPVQPVVLDLPLIPGAEVAHAPWLGVSARVWPGAVALHQRTGTDSFELQALLASPASLGVTETGLARAAVGRWDYGPALRVRMLRGGLAPALPLDVLQGANLVAIGLGEEWEVFQFAQCDLVAPDTYELRQRLRGQFGSDGIMPDLWPEGALLVVLDARLEQLSLPRDALGVERAYRIGPASRTLDDPSHKDFAVTARGVGLRPYRPVHLRVQKRDGADLAITWIRRSREGGDPWGSADIPLAEAYERYVLQVRIGTQIAREVVLHAPEFVYTAAMQAADGAGPAFRVEVAQVSDIVGPGPFASAEVVL
jgi:hypothetical protein